MGNRSRSSQSVLFLCAHLAWGVPLVALCGPVLAQALPPAIRACAAVSDADRRHACYDREVARSLEAERQSSSGTGAPRSSGETHVSSRSSSEAPAAVPTTDHPRPDEKHETGSSHSGDQTHGRLTAHLLSVDSSPGELVLRLDNGEVWQEIERTAGDLSLRAGDTVTIERHLGSYWLSARHITGMRVRKRS